MYGDESQHDSLRGGPYSGFGVSIWVGPLSALSFNRGLATESGRGYQASPPRSPPPGSTPRSRRAASGCGWSRVPAPRRPGAPMLASVQSPPMQTLVRLMNKPSDNFFAEILPKDLAMRPAAWAPQRPAPGWRPASRAGSGARARLADGSGLSRGNRASPYRVVRLLAAMSGGDEYDAWSTRSRSRARTARSRPGCARGWPARAAAARPERSRT